MVDHQHAHHSHNRVRTNAPSAASLAQGTGSNLTVTWTAPAVDSTHNAATGYNLRSSPSGAGTWTPVSGVTSPYTLTGLAAGAAYDVQVQSFNGLGLSAWSTPSTLTTAAAVYIPNTPGAAGPGTGQRQQPHGDLDGLGDRRHAQRRDRLQSAIQPVRRRHVDNRVRGVTSPYTLTGLAAGAAFDVQVQSSNAAGASGWSATSTLTTAAAGPYAPNAPAIASVAPPPDGTNTKLTVTWTAPTVDSTHGAATGYNLRYSPSGAGTWTTMSKRHQPVHDHRPGGRNRDRRRSSSDERRGKPGCVVRQHDN